jgi:hypothetical protein
MQSRNTFFGMSRRATLSAFAALPVLPMLFPVSALADIGAIRFPHGMIRHPKRRSSPSPSG